MHIHPTSLVIVFGVMGIVVVVWLVVRGLAGFMRRFREERSRRL